MVPPPLLLMVVASVSCRRAAFSTSTVPVLARLSLSSFRVLAASASAWLARALAPTPSRAVAGEIGGVGDDAFDVAGRFQQAVVGDDAAVVAVDRGADQVQRGAAGAG